MCCLRVAGPTKGFRKYIILATNMEAGTYWWTEGNILQWVKDFTDKKAENGGVE